MSTVCILTRGALAGIADIVLLFAWTAEVLTEWASTTLALKAPIIIVAKMR